jgi:hydrogenase expression/formation protein HypE
MPETINRNSPTQHWHSNTMRDRNTPPLPVGKLPPHLLARLLNAAPLDDPRVLLGPGVGLDCAVIDLGEQLLVCKSDPVTFATDQLGAYLVQVNANDLATTGATPSWLLVTLLLPENEADEAMAERLMAQIGDTCRKLDIALVGGHTEITYGLDRPVAVGALLGLVERDHLVTPRGARPGDRLLLTKSVPIEATAILARERSERLGDVLTDADIAKAQGYLNDPGIGVTRDAQLALDAGRVTAMHDPTEGGLATALWELAQASRRGVRFDPAAVPVTPLSAQVCAAFAIDPLTAIASGALLLTAPAPDADRIRAALEQEGIPCTEIGEVTEGPPQVLQFGGSRSEPYPLPERDGLAQVLASSPDSKGAEQWSALSLRRRGQPESSPTDGDLPDDYR